MKILRIKTDNTVQVLQYPEEKSIRSENKKLRELIGAECDCYKRVRPRRLYEELGAGSELTRFKGDAVSMLIDEEGRLKNLPVNATASWLYGTDAHGCPIVGDVLIVGECWGQDDISFCGLSDYNYGILFEQIQMLAELARRAGHLKTEDL